MTQVRKEWSAEALPLPLPLDRERLRELCQIKHPRRAGRQRTIFFEVFLASPMSPTEEYTSYVSRILRLALLAPDIVEAILARSTDQALVLERLERPLPASWEAQLKHQRREPVRSISPLARRGRPMISRRAPSLSAGQPP